VLQLSLAACKRAFSLLSNTFAWEEYLENYMQSCVVQYIITVNDVGIKINEA
jgi:hypothetical protein